MYYGGPHWKGTPLLGEKLAYFGLSEPKPHLSVWVVAPVVGLQVGLVGLDGLGGVGQGVPIVLQAQVRDGAVGMVHRVGGVQLDGLAVQLDCLGRVGVTTASDW